MSNQYQLGAFALVAVIVAAFVVWLAGGVLRSALAVGVAYVAPFVIGAAVGSVIIYAGHWWAVWMARAVSAWRKALYRPSDVSGLMDQRAEVVEHDEQAWDNGERWRQEVLIFSFIANREGFSFRSMRGYVTRPEWEAITGLLVSETILQSGKGGTRWARGWNYPRFSAEVRNGLLSLPYPETVPPSVRWARALPVTVGVHSTHSTHSAQISNSGGD